MYQGARIAVVIPAHDEERLVERAIRAVPGFVDIICVVDDGSRDATAERARACGDARVRVLRHARNRGVGAAIATGYAEVFGAGADVAVVMAGDAQMHGADLPALLVPLLSDEADYAKGDRLRWPGARRLMPRARFLGNHALSWLTRLATGLPVSDSQCGYTAITRRAAERLPLESLWPRYGYPNDLLGHARLRGLRVVDVPVRPVYADERSGIGWRHALFVIPALLLRVALRRMASRLAALVRGDSHPAVASGVRDMPSERFLGAAAPEAGRLDPRPAGRS
jgi:glycosyltransferase involved in cell wall biosynthesis